MITHTAEQATKPKAKGQLGTLLVILITAFGFLFGAIAADMAHMMVVRSELQNAADAGALAGAQDLWFAIDKADDDALAVAAKNTADGHPVSNASPGTEVKVTVIPPQGEQPGRVMVTASMSVGHLFAPFFGRINDIVEVTSVAGTSGRLWLLSQNQAFPLAVSLDTRPEMKDSGLLPALNTHKLGDTVTLYLGSQKVKNAAFTSLSDDRPASASYIKDAIDQALGIKAEVPGFIPSVQIGEQINLNNGIDAQRALTREPLKSAMIAAPCLVLPAFTGDPAMNQSRQVVGFIGLDVINVEWGGKGGVIESITGILVNPQVSGEAGSIPTTGNPINDLAIDRLELQPIQLIR